MQTPAAAAAVVPPNPNPYPNLNPMSSSSSNSNSTSQQQQQQQHDNHQDPHRDSWYPYSNGTTHFDGNIAMILIFIISALVCALALNTAIRFFLRYSRGATATPTQHQLPHDHQHQHQHQNDDDQKLTTTTTQSLWLPTLVFSSGTKMKLAGVGTGADDAAAECAICLSEFVEGEGVGILPKCKHGFHVKCIQGWLSSHVSCPTCRTTCLPPSPSPPPPPPDNHHNYDVESPPLSASQLLQRPASE